MSRWLAAAMLAVGCSASSPEPTTTEFETAQIATVTSANGAYVVTVYPPAGGLVQGIDTLKALVTDAHSNAPIDGLTVEIVPWMPTMGHGSSAIPIVTAAGSGAYLVTDLTLFMPGTWQLRTTLGDDSALISVEVP
jgi:hypothetical protein